MRTLCGFQKIGSTFHGYAQSPLFKGVWTFRVCADVSHCFHSASTGADTTTGIADTTAGTAASLKNAERFTENSKRFSENGERFILGTAISHAGTTISVTS